MRAPLVTLVISVTSFRICMGEGNIGSWVQVTEGNRSRRTYFGVLHPAYPRAGLPYGPLPFGEGALLL